MQNSNSNFIHLHTHSEYSLVDGMIRVKDLVNEAKVRGHSHIALTDHGNMFGAIDFYMAAKAADVIPILGCEIFHSGGEATAFYSESAGNKLPDAGAFHLVLLAKNTAGYKKLLKIVSSGYIENLHDIPICPDSVIDQYCGDDLVCLSACQRGNSHTLYAPLDTNIPWINLSST
ncbi:MAG: PHP domain-containing protein [Bdellovibrionota bacterium]